MNVLVNKILRFGDFENIKNDFWVVVIYIKMLDCCFFLYNKLDM